MMDGPASRSGQRLCAHINYPLPLIDCQTLCAWKPPIGPDVNNCSMSGCVLRDRRGPKHTSSGQNIYHKQFPEKKGHIHFLLQPIFYGVLVPHNIQAAFPFNRKWEQVKSGLQWFKGWHLFLHWVIRWSLGGRWTGFYFKDLCCRLEDLFWNSGQLEANIGPSFDRQLGNSAFVMLWVTIMMWFLEHNISI